MSLIDKEGNIIPHNSLVTWNVWDNDDFKTWKMIGIVRDYGQLSPPFHGTTQYVIYLGGGIDFGGGIGNLISFEDITEESENNDPDDRGITVLGKASEVPNTLKNHYCI